VIARLAVLLIAVCVAHPAAAFQFGVCTHLALQRGDAQQVLSLADAGGFDSLRDDVFWGAIESQRGELRFPAKYDELREALSGATARGHSPVIVLGVGNRHYDDGGLIRSDAGIAAYARYAGFVASALKAQVRRFEIWNEWNSGFASRVTGSDGTARDYVRMLGPAAAAIRAAHPRAEVIGGVTSGVDLAWYRELIAAGGLAHLDAVSVHSYTLFRREINPEGAIASIDKLRRMLVEAAPQREIPVYVTEIGWPTNDGKHGVSERDSASYLVRFTLLARSRPWIGGVWWYDLVDDGDSDSKSEHRFGLVRRDLTPKPAFRLAAPVAKLLRSGGVVQAHRFANGGYLVTGTDDAGAWAVGWSLSARHLAWEDGSTTELAVPAQFAALAAQLPADGHPLLFRRVGGQWRADASWLEAMKRPDAPALRASAGGAA
jgi:hypothetical protein